MTRDQVLELDQLLRGRDHELNAWQAAVGAVARHRHEQRLAKIEKRIDVLEALIDRQVAS
jgi:succinate dehydrogenase flavin-adding protein (antitoxin of CptAB toxin-antitoxin module)